MELLVRGMVFVQLDDVLHRELVRQRRRPALQFVGGQQQWVAVLVNGALSQAHNPARRIGRAANAVQIERVSPQAHAFAFAQVTPQGVGIVHALGGNGLDWRAPWIPLDDEGNLALQGPSLGADLLHDLQGTQPRVGTKQKRQWGQLCRHRQDPLQVQFGLQRRVLHARAQGQLQAVAQRAQVGGAGGVAIHTLVGTPDRFLLGARVVHHKRVPVHSHVAAGQSTEVHGARCVLGRQQGLIELPGQLKPRGRMAVQRNNERNNEGQILIKSCLASDEKACNVHVHCASSY